MTDHVTLRLHTGGLNLTNYVTSEGNWLHQILFRGFIAKGVNTYARTTFPFFIFSHFLKHAIFFISLHQFGLFCLCPLHEIKIKIGQPPRGMNPFARHCINGDLTLCHYNAGLRESERKISCNMCIHDHRFNGQLLDTRCPGLCQV